MELKKEDRMLLDYLRADSDEADLNWVEPLTELEWDLVIQQSIRHSVTPILYQQLKRLSPKVPVPDGVFKKLRDIYLQNAARNMRLYHGLSKALKVLKDAGIPVVVLKGGHLGEVVYGNIGLRTLCDVDLLFKMQDMGRGQKRLMNAGFLSGDSQLALDVHWNIDISIKHINIDLEDLWGRAQPTVIAGVEVLALCPEDLLLHICVHLAFHHLFEFAGLRSFCDIREIVRHYGGQMEWEQIRQRAKDWGVTNCIYITLVLARELLDAKVPDDVIEALKPADSDSSMKTWAMEQIFHGTGDTLSLSPYFLQLWKHGPFKEKVISLLKLVLPSPEFISQKYLTPFGSKQNYLYYFIRLKEHYKRYSSAVWRIMSRDREMLFLVEQQNRNIAMRDWLSSD